jgi:hypothetical protein
MEEYTLVNRVQGCNLQTWCIAPIKTGLDSKEGEMPFWAQNPRTIIASIIVKTPRSFWHPEVPFARSGFPFSTLAPTVLGQVQTHYATKDKPMLESKEKLPLGEGLNVLHATHAPIPQKPKLIMRKLRQQINLQAKAINPSQPHTRAGAPAITSWPAKHAAIWYIY